MKQTTNNKGKRIAAGVAGGVLVLGLLLAADAVYGDPLSRAWAESRAVQYAESLYPGQTFIVTESYDGSRFEYGTLVQSEQSPDTRFEVRNSFWAALPQTTAARMTPGSHEWLVEQRWNTAYRHGHRSRPPRWTTSWPKNCRNTSSPPTMAVRSRSAAALS